MSITICLLLLFETFQRYILSNLNKYQTRLFSMDIHIFQKAIHRIMLENLEYIV